MPRALRVLAPLLVVFGLPFFTSVASAQAQILMGDAAKATYADSNPRGLAQAFQYIATSSGTTTDVEFFANSGTTATSVEVGLYTDSGGKPSTLFASGHLSSPQSSAWNDVPLQAAALNQGQAYWIALLPLGGKLTYLDTIGGSRPSYVESNHSLTSLPTAYASGSEYNVSPASAYVNGTPPVAAPTNTAAPVVSGTASEGSTLSSSTGSWTNSPTAFQYQWQDCNTSGGACGPISGATAPTYTVAAGDVGYTLRAVLTACNSSGCGSAASAATAVVAGTSAASGTSFACPSGVRCFFIDFASGSDSNSGTSEASPWKDAPGMRGFSGSYTHQAGDEFIFKGGDDWPNADFPLVPRGSGNTTHSDYYGVDPQWYTGANFTRPKFDAQNADINSGGKDVMVDLTGVDYITLDDIELENFRADASTSTTYGSCDMIAAYSPPNDQHLVLNRLYMHSIYATEGHDCYMILAATYSPFAGNSVLENSTLTSDNTAYITGVKCFGNVENDQISGMYNLVFPCGHGEISGNSLHDCADAGSGSPTDGGTATGLHNNAIESLNSDGTFYFHDNVLYNISLPGATTNGCESMIIGNPGETDYVWNNVLYNLNSNPISLTQNSLPGVAAYIWDNSLEGGFGGSAYCIRAGHPATWPAISIQNNFCASTAGAATDPSLSASSLTIDHNVLLTPSQTTSDGYETSSGSYPYLPPSGSSPSASAGVSLTSDCSGAMSGLCYDTTFGGVRGTLSRPSSGAWDVGAYEVP